MASEWLSTDYGTFAGSFVEDRLADICDPNAGVQTGPFGSQLHQKDYVANGTPIITVEHLGENRILHEGIPQVSDQDRDRLSRYSLKAGDIVFSRVGSVDRRALVRPAESGWLFSGRCLRVRPDPNRIDPGYLSYFFGLPAFKERIRAIAVGATMPSLNTQILSDILIPHPRDIGEQGAIAHVLRTLDEKIEGNRRMGETLEAMVRALFKSWFVDFDPVRANSEGLDAGLPRVVTDRFPDHLEASEMGGIPEGWRVGTLDQVIDVALGGDWGADKPTKTHSEPVHCIRGADIPDLQAGGIGKMPVRFLKRASLERRRLTPGNLVMEISGGSPTQSTGRPVLVSEGLLNRLQFPLTCSNFCRMLTLKSPFPPTFVYLWLRWLYSNGDLLQFENGTTGIKNLAFTLFRTTQKLVIPPTAILSAFDRLASPLFQSRQMKAADAATLAELRNTLLPRLVSGTLPVRRPDTEPAVPANGR